MSPNDNEPLHNIPKIVPDRDEVVSRQRQKPAGRQRSADDDARRAAAAEPAAGRSSGPLVWILALIALAGVGWAGYLQLQQAESQSLLAAYQLRIEDLESRLSVTDESVNESSVAMQVKLKELDSEIRKLWDNVWKKTEQTLGDHSTRLAALDKSVKSAQGSAAELEKKLNAQASAVAEMRKQLERSSRSEATVELNKRKLEEQQVALEALSEKLNRISEEQTRLSQRVGSNEEWVQSINNFRRQTNRELVNLKAQLGGGTLPMEPLP
ncbi:MAG: hypothetical protein RBS88_04870 [Spongiibacteraceae bacterium]|jgi:methyl-accepting chemotaxis protein|nr:hypothetical protein [Spongiibacteraceae bacterium]